MQERDLRRVAYTEYIDALDDYATAAASRWETCVPGTDDSRAGEASCHPTIAEYQTSRYTFQGERNDMELIASDEALTLATAIGQTLPNSSVGLAGDARDDEPLQGTFTFLYDQFLQLAACDTSPNPRDACSAVRSYVESELGLKFLTDITRQRLGREPEVSTMSSEEYLELLRERYGETPEPPDLPD